MRALWKKRARPERAAKKARTRGKIVTGAGKCSIQPKTRNQETDMSEHKHGEMDIEVQENTFAGFMTFITRAAIAVILVLLFAYLING